MVLCGRSASCLTASGLSVRRWRAEGILPGKGLPQRRKLTRMRLFVALPVTDTAMMGTLARIVSRLHATGADFRWVPPENWHVTLQFLGNASVEQCECIVQALREVRSPAVRVDLGGLAILGRDGALVGEVVPRAPLLRLQAQVAQATVSCGFAAETRPYHPHITLARSRRGARRQLPLPRGEWQPAPVLIGEFVLYESQLGPGGARYVVRQRIPLS